MEENLEGLNKGNLSVSKQSYGWNMKVCSDDAKNISCKV